MMMRMQQRLALRYPQRFQHGGGRAVIVGSSLHRHCRFETLFSRSSSNNNYNNNNNNNNNNCNIQSPSPVKIRRSSLAQPFFGACRRFQRSMAAAASGSNNNDDNKDKKMNAQNSGDDSDDAKMTTTAAATTTTTIADTDTDSETTTSSVLLYEGPFSSLLIRLKRISVTSAAVSLVGFPLLFLLQGGEAEAAATAATAAAAAATTTTTTTSVPTVGKMAVGGTALLAATGSTLALQYVFGPYVHTLEQVEQKQQQQEEGGGRTLLKATVRNVLTQRVEYMFDPATDVIFASEGSNGSSNRPFCNFTIQQQQQEGEKKGIIPLYVHPELLPNPTLQKQLLGKTVAEEAEQQQQKKKKDPEDDDSIL